MHNIGLEYVNSCRLVKALAHKLTPVCSILDKACTRMSISASIFLASVESWREINISLKDLPSTIKCLTSPFRNASASEKHHAKHQSIEHRTHGGKRLKTNAQQTCRTSMSSPSPSEITVAAVRNFCHVPPPSPPPPSTASKKPVLYKSAATPPTANKTNTHPSASRPKNTMTATSCSIILNHLRASPATSGPLRGGSAKFPCPPSPCCPTPAAGVYPGGGVPVMSRTAAPAAGPGILPPNARVASLAATSDSRAAEGRQWDCRCRGNGCCDRAEESRASN